MRRFVKSAISFGVIFYLIWVLDWDRVSQLSWIAIAFVVGGSVGTLLLNGFLASRWRLLVIAIGKSDLPVLEAYRGYLIGSFFSIFLPGSIGGDLVRIRFAAVKAEIGLYTSGIVVFLERVFGVLALVAILVVGLAACSQNLDTFGDRSMPWVVTGAAFVGIAGAIAISVVVSELSLTVALTVFSLSLVAQLFDTVISFYLLSFVWPEAKLSWILVAMPIGFFATVLPISLGGLGVREGALVGVLALFGVDSSAAIIFSFMIYFSKSIAGVVGGIVFYRTQAHYEGRSL